jgi:hypothetical protein
VFVILYRYRSRTRTRGAARLWPVDEYVTQPFDPTHFVEIVRRSLPEHTPQA